MIEAVDARLFSRRRERDGITDADCAGANDACQHALLTVFHQLTEPSANAVHFLAGITRLREAEDSAANLNRLAGQGHQLDSERLNVGADRARWDGGDAEQARVLGNLFAFDQTHLPRGGLATQAPATEIAWLSSNAHFLDYFDRGHGYQWFADDDGMEVQGSDTPADHSVF